MALEMLRPVCRNTGREQLAWMKSDPDMDPLREDPDSRQWWRRRKHASRRHSPDFRLDDGMTGKLDLDR